MLSYTLSMFAPLSAAFPFHIQGINWTEDRGPWENQDFLALTFVLGGTAVLRAGRRDTPLRKGDWFVLHARTAYSVAQVRELRAVSMLFRLGDMLEKEADAYESPGFRALFLPPAPQAPDSFQGVTHLDGAEWESVKYLVTVAQREYEARQEGCQTLLAGQLQFLTVHLSRLYTRQAGLQTDGESGLSGALQWIGEHYTEDISLETLSGIVGISPRHLDRLFRSKYYITPKSYIVKLRIDKARTLLLRTDKSVTDIAFECGYTDSNYFARVFRKYSGTSPQQYRKTLQKPPEQRP